MRLAAVMLLVTIAGLFALWALGWIMLVLSGWMQ
jgi:hypothetical protein